VTPKPSPAVQLGGFGFFQARPWILVSAKEKQRWSNVVRDTSSWYTTVPVKFALSPGPCGEWGHFAMLDMLEPSKERRFATPAVD
jgi:hypothetical protein